MERDKFVGLKQGDLLVLNLFAEGIPDEVKKLLVPMRIQSPATPALCEVTTPPADPDADLLRALVKLVYGNGRPFEVAWWQVLREATEEDATKNVVSGQLTKSDLQVFENPAVFVEKDCGYRWLPSHGGQLNSVRDRYQKWVDNNANPDGISKEGGMLALLDYRSATSERLLEIVAQETRINSTNKRAIQVSTIPADVMSADQKHKYVAAVRRVVGKAPGSTEPSSDIDINTQGDGTEFAVRRFNAMFKDLYGGFEPGIVFDVNIYGKDFLPSFKDWPPRQAGERGRLIRPPFDHEFSDYTTIELEDAKSQLTSAFIKLRRYMPSRGEKEADWEWFTQWFKDDGELRIQLGGARDQHLKWALAIAQSARNRVEPESALFAADKELITTAGEVYLKTVDPATLMQVQNCFYEYFLEHGVKPERDKFNLLKFQKAPVAHLDAQYKKLRDAMSRSLYFANEAYVTAGAVVQTVGGKQVKSRGVVPGYTAKQSFHNIAYTAHELMASVIDQLADIHKEAGRHFEHAANDVGGALLGCGKYIHRMLNAVKHLYVLFEKAGLPTAAGAFPHALFRDKDGWERFRPLSFGLEASKKMKFDTAEWGAFRNTAYPFSEDAYNSLKASKGESILSLLVNKFSQTRD
jgi:hypothetical protein